MLAEASDSGWCAAGWQSVWHGEWGVEFWAVKNCTRTPSCRVSEEDWDISSSPERWSWPVGWGENKQKHGRANQMESEDFSGWVTECKHEMKMPQLSIYCVEWHPELGAMSTKTLGMYWSGMPWLQVIYSVVANFQSLAWSCQSLTARGFR